MTKHFDKKPRIERKELFEKVMTLTPTEEKELAAIESMILSDSTKKKKAVLADISKIGFIDKIYKYCLANEVFNQFCLLNKPLLDIKWAEILEIVGHPSDPISSLDKNQNLSIFQLYTGSYFLSEYLKFKKAKPSEATIDARTASLYLDLACEQGLFQAIEERCLQNKIIIKSSNSKDYEITDALVQIYTDTQRLSNLYWTVGHLHSALILIDIGSHFANKTRVEDQNRGDSFLITAAEQFLRAKELSNYKALDTDKKIQKVICGEKGLMTFEFENWDQAQSFFLNRVNADIAPHPKMIMKAKQYIQHKLQGSRHNIIG